MAQPISSLHKFFNHFPQASYFVTREIFLERNKPKKKKEKEKEQNSNKQTNNLELIPSNILWLYTLG